MITSKKLSWQLFKYTKSSHAPSSQWECRVLLNGHRGKTYNKSKETRAPISSLGQYFHLVNCFYPTWYLGSHWHYAVVRRNATFEHCKWKPVQQKEIEGEQAPAKETSQKWKAPPAGVLKKYWWGLHWSKQSASKKIASQKRSKQSGEWGFTLKNDLGVLLATGSGNLEHVSNPLYAELLSFQQVVHTAIQKGCQKGMFETDCMVPMQAILLVMNMTCQF